jgi:hypothetical protein
MSLVCALGKVIKTNKYYYVKFNNEMLSRQDNLYLAQAQISIVIKYIDGYTPIHEVTLVITQYAYNKSHDIPQDLTTPDLYNYLHNILHIQTLDVRNNNKIKLPNNCECAGFFMETYKLPARIEILLNGHEYMNLEKWQYKQIGQNIYHEKSGLDTYTRTGIKKCLTEHPRLKIFWIPFATDKTWNDKTWISRPTGILLSRVDKTHFRATSHNGLKIHLLCKQFVAHPSSYHIASGEFIVLN